MHGNSKGNLKDPFSALRRKARLQAQLGSWRRKFMRPLRPDRIDPDRQGPANLLLVGIDTLRADHLGCHGYRQPTSPFLDKMAFQGTLFSDVTASAPWTLPSFSSSLCGVMPGVHGAYLTGATRNMDSQPPLPLNQQMVTLARHLGQQGYRTAAFYSNQFFAFGIAESFDEHSYHNLAAGDLLELAMDWIRQNADQPYFCFVLLNDPHEPTTPEVADLEPFLGPLQTRDIPCGPAELKNYARWGDAPALHLGKATQPETQAVQHATALKVAIYDATIRYVDRCLATVQWQLRDWGLEPSTLVSVFSDHGEEFLDHHNWSQQWNHDPRGIHGIGHGHSLFQELLHVPWISWGPGVPRGFRSREPVSLCDLAFTLCDWLKLDPLRPALPDHPFAPNLQGQSQGSPAKSEPTEDRLILAEAIAYGPDLVALRKGRWKLIAHRDGRPLALFDLLGSPDEKIDVQQANPDVVREFVALLAQWTDTKCGADGGSAGEQSWDDMEDTVRQRLKDLGYSE